MRGASSSGFGGGSRAAQQRCLQLFVVGRYDWVGVVCDASYGEGVLVSDLGGMGTGPLGRDEVHMRRDAVPLMDRWEVAYRDGGEPKQVALVRMRCGQRNVWLEVGESENEA